MRVINNIIIYLYSILIIFFPYTVYMYKLNWRIVEIVILVLSLMVLLISIISKEKYLFRFTFILSIYLIIWILFLLSKGSEALIYANLFLIFPFSFFIIIKKYGKHNLFKAIGNVVFYYAIFNIITYLIFSVFKVVPSTSQYILEENGWVYKGFYSLYYEVQKIYTSFGVFTRNSGVFNEPSVYGLTLNLGLICEMYFLKNRIIRKVILLIAIMSTTATSGIIITGILMFIYILPKIMKVKYIPVIIIAIIVLCTGVFSMLESKSDSGSYVNRREDYSVGIRVGMKSPMLGLNKADAYNNIRLLQNELVRGKDNLGGVANIYMQIFVNMGLVGLLWYFSGIFLYFFYEDEESFQVRISILIFVLLSAHSYSGMYFLWVNLFVFYGYLLFFRRLRLI